MNPSMKSAQKGFTLVELSMVLVVIGLLAGGVLGLHSYVRNAGLSTMMNEGKYYVGAFIQFQARYNAPPGDYKNAGAAWAGAGAGDGNGLIRATGAAPGNRDEWFYSFQHLAFAGFIQGKYTGATAGAGGTYYAQIGTNVPGASMGKVAFLFDHPDAMDGVLLGDSFYFDGIYPNLLRIAGLNDNATNIPNQPFLTPKQAYQLDEKFDDGMPGQGNVLTPIPAALANCALNATSYDTNAANADKISCYFLVRMQ